MPGLNYGTATFKIKSGIYGNSNDIDNEIMNILFLLIFHQICLCFSSYDNKDK